MSPQLRAKLEYRSQLDDQLRQLSVLVGRSVGAEELGPPEHVLEMRQALSGARLPVTEWSMPFEDRGGDRFRDYLGRLGAARPGPIEIVTPAAAACGTLTVPSLETVEIGFPFDLNHGVVSFSTPDWLDGIDLDWERDAGEETLNVNVSGEAWASIRY